MRVPSAPLFRDSICDDAGACGRPWRYRGVLAGLEFEPGHSLKGLRLANLDNMTRYADNKSEGLKALRTVQ